MFISIAALKSPLRRGAPLSAVHSRWRGGESVESIAADYEVPLADINEAIDALWPHQIAA